MSFLDFVRDPTGQPKSNRTGNPLSCPKCGSPTISTAAKNPNPTSYWRCGSCGEIWNQSRPLARAGGGWR
jgi:predicted RNA-binding Zn-ribbon protein involved in translation (DUF1610 family)